MKKLLLIISLLTTVCSFAQIPYTQTFGTGTVTPSGWNLNAGFAINAGTYFASCTLPGSSGGSYLIADNSLSGTASASFAVRNFSSEGFPYGSSTSNTLPSFTR